MMKYSVGDPIGTSWVCSTLWGDFEQEVRSRGVKLIFTEGHISLAVAFKGPNVILGL